MKTKSNRLRILITGAADGVGLECARAFADLGSDLILCDNDGIGLTRASNQLSAFSRYCDVSSEASVVIFAAKIEESFQSFDVLINTAGSGYVRTLGMMRMSHAMLPMMRRATGNRFIFNVKPEADISPGPLFRYASSPTGFERLSEALAEQTKGSAIHVEAMTPKLRSNRFPSVVAIAPDESSQPQAVDTTETAQRIVALVKANRPEWRARSILQDRCA